MLHWAHLPVALWSVCLSLHPFPPSLSSVLLGATCTPFTIPPVDRRNDHAPYDDLAIYSGSATLGPGDVPTIVYAAVGKPPNAPYRFSYGLAVPKNRSDPLLREWVKPGYSPIISPSASDDPSSAWQTADKKEWRFIGPGEEYSSPDFVNWEAVGQHGLPPGDCPSLFPLDVLLPATPPATANWSRSEAGVPGPGVRRCGQVDGGHDTLSGMCAGATADGELHVSESEIRSRCGGDDACKGYAQYLPRGAHDPATYYRPVTDTSTTHPDVHWRTWTQNGGPDPTPPTPAPPRQRPTHVHKQSGPSGDKMQVGRWIEGAPGRAGTWTYVEDPWGGNRVIDRGAMYASKDFYDPVGRRRILWGWATNGRSGVNVNTPTHPNDTTTTRLGIDQDALRVQVGGCRSDGVDPALNNCLSTQSLPRVVSWNDTLQQLVFSPLAEQLRLRGDLLFPPVTNTVLHTGVVRALGSWPETSAGNQSEVEVTFALPRQAARFGVTVMGGGNGTAPAGGVCFFVDFKPPPPGSGAEGVYNVTVGATEGGLVETPASGTITDVLRLAPSDTVLKIRIFVDNTFAECFWMDGRAVMSIPLLPTVESSMTMAAAVGDVTVIRADAWVVGSIWVTPEEVLSASSE